MNIKQLFVFSLLGLLPLSVLSGGKHNHKHDKNPNCTKEDMITGPCFQNDNHVHKSTVGQPADVNDATETIHVRALDSMRFEFDKEFDIVPGKTITFIVTNAGKVRHEFSIGNEADQINHAKAMMNNPDMVHADGDAAMTLEAGETKRLTWTFAGHEDVVFACTLPGHYQAGMLHKQKIRR